MPDETKNVEDMSLAELTAEYNRKVEELEANHTGLKPIKFQRIKLFKDRKAGIRRLHELANPKQVSETATETTAEQVAPKRAKAPPKEKAAPKEKAPRKAKPEKTGSLSETFGFKAGGDRDKLLLILSGRMGQPVPRADLGECAKFLGKIKLRIARKKLKYKLEKVKTDDGVGYVFSSK